MIEASCIIIKNPYNNKILSISRPEHNNKKYGLIGGKKDSVDKDIHDTTIRELIEELSLQDNNIYNLQSKLEYLTTYKHENNFIAFFLWSMSTKEFFTYRKLFKAENDKHLKWIEFKDLCKSSISPFYIENTFIYNYLQEIDLLSVNDC